MEETGGLRRRLRRYWAMRKDPDESAMLTASLSFFVNAAIGVGKLLLGIGLGSFWFVVNGAYYLLLCIARGRAVGQYRRALAMDGGARAGPGAGRLPATPACSSSCWGWSTP